MRIGQLLLFCFASPSLPVKWSKCPAVRKLHRISMFHLNCRAIPIIMFVCKMTKYKHWACCTLTPFKLEKFVDLRQKASFNSNEKMRCSIGLKKKNHLISVYNRTRTSCCDHLSSTTSFAKCRFPSQITTFVIIRISLKRQQPVLELKV